MPRGRPDPFSQVPDGGRVHLAPDLQILEQDGPQLDEPQGRLAPGDDGVHARTVAVVGTHAAIAVTVQRGRIAAGSAVSFTSDEIDERCFLGLLHGLPSLCCGRGLNGAGTGSAGGSGGPERRVLAQYTGPNDDRQEGNRVWMRFSRGIPFGIPSAMTRHPPGSRRRVRRAHGRSHRFGRPDRPRSGWSVSANPRP
jgi:hypothetical protein